MNVFDIIPSDFFNCLAGNSNNRVYADCLELIHNQYDKEISYRLERSYLRDVLAAFLLEKHLDLTDEENTANAGNDEANFVLRKFISVGWLEEDQDDSTFEKYIVMTDNGIALAEFLHKLKRPATPEFSSYILNIYNRFNSKEYANKQELYNFILKPTFSDAKALSSDLKKLSTSIKKIIEKMNHEGSLESLTENIISYCDGDFIKEYSRLVHQQNIHIYRNFITRKLDEMKQPEYFNLLCTELSAEEKAHKVLISNMEAEERVYEMIDSTKKFLHDDYNKIMDDIKLKINTYIHIAIARERMLRNKGLDIRGVVEQTLRILISSENSSEKEELGNLFNIQKYEYVDQSSVMYPHKSQQILHNTESDYFELSKEEIERQKYILEQESHNPYSKDQMKKYMDDLFMKNEIIDNSQFNYSNKEDILKSLAAVSYAKENGYFIETDGTYIESENYITKHWRARKNDK